MARIKALVIPPAWKAVWICPWPNGHIQALGTDDAGRKAVERYVRRRRTRRSPEKYARHCPGFVREPASVRAVPARRDCQPEGLGGCRRRASADSKVTRRRRLN
ncbi:hypothetical protein V3C33_20545 [Micrococcaceae bacterium Sec5.7]